MLALETPAENPEMNPMSKDKPEPIPESGLTTDQLEKLLDVPFVFWVCPNGCNGTVAWNESATDATCSLCGTKRSDPPMDYQDKTRFLIGELRKAHAELDKVYFRLGKACFRATPESMEDWAVRGGPDPRQKTRDEWIALGKSSTWRSSHSIKSGRTQYQW